MNLLNPEIGTIFWSALTFLLLLFVLRKMAWKPILQTLEERETKIREALDKADAAQKQTEEAISKQQDILDEARKEAQEILNKARKTAEMHREEAIQKAESDADSLVEKARREIAMEQDKAVEVLKKNAVDLSIMIASKLIGKSLSKEDHKKIIDESIQKMEAN